MKRKELIEQYKNKRNKIKSDILSIKRTPDSVEKYLKLIKLAKSYEKVTTDMNLDGFSAKVYPATMSSQYWNDEYERFLDGRKARPVITNTDQQYNIMLCWTIKNDYCVCDSIIETMQNYFISVGLDVKDTVKSSFPDRVEFCQNYRYTGSKVSYEMLMKSAEYILNIATVSAYEKCNIGVFGKIL